MCCIGFASLQGAAPPSPLHLECFSQPLAPETPEAAEPLSEGNTEHGIFAVFSVYPGILSWYPINKPPSFF